VDVVVRAGVEVDGEPVSVPEVGVITLISKFLVEMGEPLDQ